MSFRAGVGICTVPAPNGRGQGQATAPPSCLIRQRAASNARWSRNGVCSSVRPAQPWFPARGPSPTTNPSEANPSFPIHIDTEEAASPRPLRHGGAGRSKPLSRVICAQPRRGALTPPTSNRRRSCTQPQSLTEATTLQSLLVPSGLVLLGQRLAYFSSGNRKDQPPICRSSGEPLRPTASWGRCRQPTCGIPEPHSQQVSCSGHRRTSSGRRGVDLTVLDRHRNPGFGARLPAGTRSDAFRTRLPPHAGDGL